MKVGSGKQVLKIKEVFMNGTLKKREPIVSRNKFQEGA
jgi:hypothetical protein